MWCDGSQSIQWNLDLYLYRLLVVEKGIYVDQSSSSMVCSTNLAGHLWGPSFSWDQFNRPLRLGLPSVRAS